MFASCFPHCKEIHFFKCMPPVRRGVGACSEVYVLIQRMLGGGSVCTLEGGYEALRSASFLAVVVVRDGVRFDHRAPRHADGLDIGFRLMKGVVRCQLHIMQTYAHASSRVRFVGMKGRAREAENG